MKREPRICFEDDRDCTTGELVYVADPVGSLPRLDLAFVSVPYPDGLDTGLEETEVGLEIRIR